MRSTKQALFSGVLDSDTGPAIVNRAYVSRGDGWLAAPARHPGPATLLWFARRHRHLGGVLVSSTSSYHVILLLLARAFRTPGFYLAHGVAKTEMQINGRRSLRHAWVEALTIGLATEILAVSPALATDMRVAFPRARGKVAHVTNGGEGPQVVGRVAPAPVPGRVRIMTVGTSPIKNFDLLLAALEEARAGEVELVVVGRAQEPLRTSNPTVYVIEHRFLSHEEVLMWMRSSDIYVQVSDFESFGLAVCEAASQGCSLLLGPRIGARDALTGIGAANVVESPVTASDIAAKLSLLISAVRDGNPSRHECIRTWDMAANELRARLGAS